MGRMAASSAFKPSSDITYLPWSSRATAAARIPSELVGKFTASFHALTMCSNMVDRNVTLIIRGATSNP